MDKQEFLSAATVLQQIGKWQNIVSQERFYKVAETKFGISERDADLLYNLFSTARKHFVYVNTEYDKKNMSALFHDANGKRWKAVDVLKLAKSEIERLPIDENRAKLLDEINRVLADNKTAAELMAEQVMRDMENERKESAE